MSKQSLWRELTTVVADLTKEEDVSRLYQLLGDTAESNVQGLHVTKELTPKGLKLTTLRSLDTDTREWKEPSSYTVSSGDIFMWWLTAVGRRRMLAATVFAFNPLFKLPSSDVDDLLAFFSLTDDAYVLGIIKYLKYTGNVVD